MRRRRLWWFLVEVAFLGGLATLAAVARMHTGAVVAVMAFGWVVVALAEWSSWLDRPHFGRGLPPRYYVPQLSLPPPLTPDQTASLRVGPVEEAETRIAPAPSWAASLDEWPVIDLERLGEDTLGAGGAVVGLVAGTDAAGPLEDTEIVAPLEAAAGEDTEVARPAAPERAEPEPSQDAAPELAPAAPPEPPSPPAAEAAAPVAAPPASARARHRIDPFVPAGGGSRFRRRDESGVIELPAGPPPERQLPAALRAAGRPGRA